MFEGAMKNFRPRDRGVPKVVDRKSSRDETRPSALYNIFTVTSFFSLGWAFGLGRIAAVSRGFFCSVVSCVGDWKEERIFSSFVRYRVPTGTGAQTCHLPDCYYEGRLQRDGGRSLLPTVTLWYGIDTRVRAPGFKVIPRTIFLKA